MTPNMTQFQTIQCAPSWRVWDVELADISFGSARLLLHVAANTLVFAFPRHSGKSGKRKKYPMLKVFKI